MNKDIVFDGYLVSELGYPEMFEHLLPLLKSGQSALDLGFGSGHMCSPFAFAGLKITGVDVDRYLLEEAVRIYREAGLGDILNTVCQDALDYMLSNEDKHDLIVMSDFLMFLMKTSGLELIKLAYESLEPEGYLWITTASTNDSFHAHLAAYQQPIDKDTYIASSCHGSGPACFYAPEEIEPYLKSLGAKVIFNTDAPNSRGRQTVIVLAQKN